MRTKVSALITLLLLLLLLLPTAPAARAEDAIAIKDRGVAVNFPDSLVFKAHVQSSAGIERIVLEYGVQQLTCASVTAKAFPVFEPGKNSVDVSWTWEMRKSGSEPAGATIWYRWRVTDKAGNEQVTDRQEVVWLDRGRSWDSLSSKKIALHWYGRPAEFGQTLLTSASSSMEELGRTIGLTTQSQVDIYVYSSNDDLREAVLYEPGWIGGQAYPEYNVVIIGIETDESSMAWGMDAIAHELAHVLVGHTTLSCLSSVPSWLNEGIAVYGEGGWDIESNARMRLAISNNSLISIRALSGEFSEHLDGATLAYAESYSIVEFLISHFGQARLLELLNNVRDGMGIEQALVAAYGFDLDGLEVQWREAIGALPPAAANPTAVTVPTAIPTYPPAVAAPLASAAGARTAPGPASPNGASGAPGTSDPNTPDESNSESRLHPVTQVWINALIAAGFSGLVAFFALWGLGHFFQPKEV